MRVISNPNEEIISLWGMTSIDDSDNIEYRIIRYHICTYCDEGVLLLNTVTGELLLLSEEEYDQLERETVKYRDCELLRHLIDNRFLVPLDFDEARSVQQLCRVFRKIHGMDCIDVITSYSLIPTTSCNARCFYCFENDYPKMTMRSQTAGRIADFIEKHCDESRTISINWFGGEPLVGYQCIDEICELLIKKKISYKSSMITNGSLFSESLIHHAKEYWKLQRVQITLDGTEEIYNSVKAYSGLKGSPFYIVFDNIGYLLEEGIDVTIRLNLDFHNKDDLVLLIDELIGRYREYPNLVIYVHELFEGEGDMPICHSNEEWQEINAKVDELNEYIVRKGCRVERVDHYMKSAFLPKLKYVTCMADNSRNIMINLFLHLGCSITQKS